MSRLSLALVFLLASGCVATSTTSQNRRPDYSAEPEDFFGVNFKPSLPLAESNLIDSLADARSRDALHHDLEIISSFPPEVPLRVEGYTDTKECSGSDCVALSLRRAQAVHDWLLAQGVPPSRLSPAYGYGSARPIADNATETGRASNRRAFISYSWQ
jgi:hypothetical protein